VSCKYSRYQLENKADIMPVLQSIDL